MARQRRMRRPTDAELVLGTEDASLLDVVDNVLNRGVVLSGDLTIALANVDLVYARLSLLLAAADRVLPGEDTDFFERHRARHVARLRAARRARSALPGRSDAKAGPAGPKQQGRLVAKAGRTRRGNRA